MWLMKVTSSYVLGWLMNWHNTLVSRKNTSGKEYGNKIKNALIKKPEGLSFTKWKKMKMTERQKEKVLLFMLMRRILMNKTDNADVEALNYILKLKNGMNYETADMLYKKACKEYRKVHKDE